MFIIKKNTMGDEKCMKYKWFIQKKKYFYKDKVIVANPTNGMWIRMSKEIYKIIDNIIRMGISDTKLTFYDMEDEYFLKNILKDLFNMEIIVEATENVLAIRNRMASVELTQRCNLHCIHCCIDAKNSLTEDSDMKYEDIIEVLKKLIIWNPKTIMLSGGEPMIRKDFEM